MVPVFHPYNGLTVKLFGILTLVMLVIPIANINAGSLNSAEHVLVRRAFDNVTECY